MGSSLLTLAILFGGATVFAPLVMAQSPSVTSISPTSKQWRPKSYTWTTQSLSKENGQYEVVKNNVDNAAKVNSLRNSDLYAAYRQLSTQYKLIFLQDPKNPVAKYRWAYATYRGISPKTNKTDGNRALIEIAEILSQEPYARSFPYFKLLFLTEYTLYPYAKEWLTIAETLHQASPKDTTIRTRLSRCLAESDNASDRQRGVEIAKKLIEEQPGNYRFHATLGYAFQEVYLRDKNVEAGKKAIVEYETVLRLAPKDSSNIDEVEQLLGALRSESSLKPQ